MLTRTALFSDETLGYRLPLNIRAGDFVTLRLRAGRGEVKEAWAVVRPADLSGTSADASAKTSADASAETSADDSDDLNRKSICFPMHLEKSDKRFDWFSGKLECGSERLEYGFLVTDGEETLLYDRTGCHSEKKTGREDGGAEIGFPETPFEIIPGFSVPDWARGAVMYQIFTDRFANGNPANDVLSDEYVYLKRPVEHASWDRPVSQPDTGVFYGGDLEGVRMKFDYLKRLGVEVLYFNPLFVSPSSHKYDTQDYEHIDPHFTGFAKDEGILVGEKKETDIIENRSATRYICRTTDPENLAYADEYFARFMEEAHQKGFKVILDGVFNHCGSFHRWMDREGIYQEENKRSGFGPGAYQSPDSPYRNHFLFEENQKYRGWWDNETLPKLNYEGSDELRKDIFAIGRKWISPPYNVDGWRLDVAADLCSTEEANHAFWQEFRKEIKNTKGDALLLAEHYGDPTHWLHGNEWDTVMNYDAFMDPVSYFLTGLEKHSRSYAKELHGNGEAFERNLQISQAKLPIEALQSAMNELSNHDHTRFLTRTNRQVGRLETKGSEAAGAGVSYATFREGVVMQFTMPGSPTIYYGDETGMVGWTDPDDRRPFPWGKENWDLIAFHRDMVRVHREYTCFRTGSFLMLLSGYGFVVYGRFDAETSAVTVVNHSIDERDMEIPVWRLEMPDDGTVLRVMQTNDVGYNVGHWEEHFENGILKVRVPAWSSTVYTYRKESLQG